MLPGTGPVIAKLILIKLPLRYVLSNGIVYNSSLSELLTILFDIFRDWELILNLVLAVGSYLLQARIPETKP